MHAVVCDFGESTDTYGICCWDMLEWGMREMLEFSSYLLRTSGCAVPLRVSLANVCFNILLPGSLGLEANIIVGPGKSHTQTTSLCPQKGACSGPVGLGCEA